MSNENLHNAINRLGSSCEPSPNFAAVIMMRVKRRQRRRRIINIAMVALCGVLFVALSTYFLVPVIRPIITAATKISYTWLLPMCGVCLLLCLMLLADTSLRRKFMPNDADY